MLRCLDTYCAGVVVGCKPRSTFDIRVVSSGCSNLETIFPVVDGGRRHRGWPAGLVLERPWYSYLK